MDLPDDILDSLQSYLPEGNDIRSKTETSREKLPKQLKDVAVGADSTSASGAVSLQTNHAAVHLLQKSGQVTIAKRMDTLNQEEQKSRLITKEKKAKALREEKRSKKSQPGPIIASLNAPAARVERVPLPETMPDTLHIQTLEQHNRRDNEVELFAMRVERPHAPTTDMITQTPPLSKTLQYCSQFPDLAPWVNQYNETLANSSQLSFQRIPLMSRSVLQTFLRERNPRCVYERDCFNLDREPRVGEGKFRCVGHRLSEKLLGEGKGYRLREILFPEQIVAINSCASDREAAQHLYPEHEMCYLCHIYLTTEKCFDQKNKAEERDAKDLTSSTTTDMIAILNRFVVTVGSEGDYDLRRMLVSDNVAMGVLGPFPMWSERHYVCSTDTVTNLRGFSETDTLVFRLPREPSELIESSRTKDSTRSTPTSVKRITMHSSQ